MRLIPLELRLLANNRKPASSSNVLHVLAPPPPSPVLAGVDTALAIGLEVDELDELDELLLEVPLAASTAR